MRPMAARKAGLRQAARGSNRAIPVMSRVATVGPTATSHSSDAAGTCTRKRAAANHVIRTSVWIEAPRRLVRSSACRRVAEQRWRRTPTHPGGCGATRMYRPDPRRLRESAACQALVRPRQTGHASLRSGLECRHHDRFDPVRFRGILCGLPSEPKPRNDSRPDATESGLFQQPEHFSLRESAADSAGPQLRVVDDRLGQLLRADDVRDGDPTAWPQDAKQLLNDATLAERQVHHTV